MEDCTWSNLGNIPGADRPPTVPDLSNDSITDLRKCTLAQLFSLSVSF